MSKKTDEELELITGRLRAESAFHPEGSCPPSDNPAVRRLRQLENDAVLDFVEELYQRRGWHHLDEPWRHTVDEIVADLKITRTPSGGCASGRCGVKAKRCERCNREFSAGYAQTVCLCGGLIQHE